MKDPALRACSLTARGLWFELLCLMHECEHRGHLSHPNGEPFTSDQIARVVGENPETVLHILGELEQCGVFSRTENNVIYSRRMVTEEKLRNVKKNNGKRGGRPKKEKPKENLNETKTPEKENLNKGSSSSSSSSSSTSVTPFTPMPDWLNPGAWSEFEQHRKDIRKPLTNLARKKNLDVLEPLGFDEQQAVVDTTISNRWTGLFPPKESNKSSGRQTIADQNQAAVDEWLRQADG